jgi:arylsulfatase A-like enzyme
MPRPNILWICTDQQRFDTIASLGNPHIRTPNLDRLAAEGTAFTHAFAQNPVCTPSRACFLTGRYPRTTRARQNGQDIPADEVLFPRMAADLGYDCGLSGKLHVSAACKRTEPRIDDGYRVFQWSHHPAPDWPDNAYIHWLEAKGHTWDELYEGAQGRPAYPGVPAEFHQTTWCAEKAIEFIDEPRDGPWLFSLNCFDPHHPFDPPREFLERYDPDALPPPRTVPGELDAKPVYQRLDHAGAYGGRGLGYDALTDRQRREVIAAYYAMVELIDDQVGRLLDHLDRTGQRGNTIVIFHSDHGEMLGDHGIYLKGPHMYDCAVRVPLIVSWPGHIEQGLRSEALVELTDLVPTLFELMGEQVPDRVQGRSFAPILTGEAEPREHREDVFAEYYNAMPVHERHGIRPYVSMIRTRSHKLAVAHDQGTGELYDLAADPGEHENLWESAAHQGVKLELICRLLARTAFTADPSPPRVAPW